MSDAAYEIEKATIMKDRETEARRITPEIVEQILLEFEARSGLDPAEIIYDSDVLLEFQQSLCNVVFRALLGRPKRLGRVPRMKWNEEDQSWENTEE